MRFFVAVQCMRRRALFSHNRNRCGEEIAGLRDIPHCDLWFFPLCRFTGLSASPADHHPSRVAHDAMGSYFRASFRGNLK